MQLTPRYDGPPLIVLDGPSDDAFAPAVRQRRRLAERLATLEPAQWATTSRCAQWRVQDVVSHLAGVTQFWAASVAAGVAGTPTRYLGGFDPVATPAQMVDRVRELSTADALAQFVASNDQFLELLASLKGDAWDLPAEAPPGHLPIRLVATHALWDAWVHERDIALPLGETPPVWDDEVSASLRYVTALSGAFTLLTGGTSTDVVAFDVHTPNVRGVVTTTDHQVTVTATTATGATPLLTGDAVEILEALSVRGPLPENAPPQWHLLLGGLRSAFDVAETV